MHETDLSVCALHPQENVSLADILCLRDGGLSEQELWAVCVECVCSLQSIGLSPLFHTLCVTPDTLAFNTHGNVCFMEQLNDDPDGCFVPPEFDKTGNTFEGHMFSLGSTLWAALDYVSELQVELSEESRCLLKQMQREKPEDRPRLQDILSQAEAVLGDVSPAVICRKLSAIGRRVLSIESLAALQGVSSQRSHNAVHLMLCEGIAWVKAPAYDLSPRHCAVSSLSGGPILNPFPNQSSSLIATRSAALSSVGISTHITARSAVPSSSGSSSQVSARSAVPEYSPRRTPVPEYSPRRAPVPEYSPQRAPVPEYSPQRAPGSCSRWISLRELLSCSAQPFSVNELWALCYTCLSTLQTYIDLPGQSCTSKILCFLESVTNHLLFNTN
uniref:KIND domain-containing protein n=1 Tax=Sinocyclocheilus anshuiensis TaxID=1608454 RepID=A0A671P310_9TELE